MIVKRNFSPLKVWSYIKGPVIFSIGWSFVVWLIASKFNVERFSLNFAVIGILGTALAIFIAFRNNSSYSRWWEARTAWSNILSSTRTFARLIITFTDSHSHQTNYVKERSESFKSEMIYKIIAWTNSLRLELRNQNDWESFRTFLSDEEINQVITKQSKTNFIKLLIGQRIYKAMADGTLGGFDSFQLEGQLLALANAQAASERIKHTPLPKQYDFFTRMFVLLFIALLPFGLISFFNPHTETSWLVIPFAVLISAVFVIMERTGAANENPFENLVTDVPLTSICNKIERDLLEMLGEENLPPKLEAENGYLY
ncbi:MAG: bestrophin family protein [Ignavibacterium sp.]